MSAALATLNGVIVTACRVQIPAYGLWWADVEADTPTAISGAVTLVVDDLVLKGTIVSGGAREARFRYRIVGGAGGWGRSVTAKSYTNDAGVKLGTVLRDVAAECGESLGTVATSTVGTSYVRSVAPAARVLDELATRAWYVDEAGVTQIGRRATTTWAGQATRITDDAARGFLELAPAAASLSTLLPGAVVDGVEAVDVEHEIDGATGKLRSTIWGRGIADTSRLPEAFRRIVEAFTATHKYYAPWEYRVVLRSSERLDLQATRVSSGMPDLRAVRIRQGSGGVRVHPALGSLCLVSFVNGDPSRPVVTSYDDQDGAGAVATELALQAGTPGAQPTEHATSAEALVLTVRTTLTALATALGGVPGAGAAITAMTTDAAFAAIVAAVTGTLGPLTKAALLASLAAKSADTGGDTPGLGWPAVRGG